MREVSGGLLVREIPRPKHTGGSRKVDPTRESLIRGRTAWWIEIEELAREAGLTKSELIEAGLRMVAESVGRRLSPRL